MLLAFVFDRPSSKHKHSNNLSNSLLPKTVSFASESCSAQPPRRRRNIRRRARRRAHHRIASRRISTARSRHNFTVKSPCHRCRCRWTFRRRCNSSKTVRRVSLSTFHAADCRLTPPRGTPTGCRPRLPTNVYKHTTHKGTRDPRLLTDNNNSMTLSIRRNTFRTACLLKRMDLRSSNAFYSNSICRNCKSCTNNS